MNNPDVTEKLNAPAASTPASGSEAQPKTISEWFRYLTETEQLYDYWNDGSEKSKAIQAGFAAWKSKQAKSAKPLNSD